MKITKTQLKQVIKEELSSVLSEEDSPMEILGVHDISDSRTLIDAVRALVDKGGINDDNSRVIRDWLSRRLQKEPDEALSAELVSLRDDMMRAEGDIDREGRTGYERRRQRRQHYRDEAEGEAAPAGRMTTRQSLGLGEGKITKAQLKQIIREELSSLSERRRGGGFNIASAASHSHEGLRNRVHKYLIDKKFFKGRVLNGRHFIEIFWGPPEGPDVPAGAGYTNPAREFLISAVDSGDIDWATWKEIEPIWKEIDRSID